MIALLFAVMVPQDTLHYDFTVRTTRTVQTTDAARPAVLDSLALTGTLTLVLNDTLGGRVAQIRVDSTQILSSPSTRVPQLTGSRYTAFLPANGDGAVVSPVGASSATVQGLPVISALFPTLRSGVAINDRWVDTADVEHTVAGIHAEGKRITAWLAVDRQRDALLLSGTFTGSTAALLEQSTSMLLNQHGTIRTVIQPGNPANVSAITDSADVLVTLSGTTLRISQVTSITLVHREFRPRPRSFLRPRVPN